MKKNTPLATHRIVELFNDSNVSGVAYKNKSLKRSILSHLDQHGEFTITELSRELNTSVPKITSFLFSSLTVNKCSFKKFFDDWI